MAVNVDENYCGDSCSGKCCKVFLINGGGISPAKLRQEFARVDKTERFSGYWYELRNIILMVKYLGYKNHILPAKTFEADENGWKDLRSPNPFHGYTCRRFDQVTGKCKHHERRPKLCSNYGTTYLGSFVDCRFNENFELKTVSSTEIKYDPNCKIIVDENKLEEV